MRRYLPRPLPEDDLTKALAQADDRMRAWLCLGAFAGLRCQEIAGVKRTDVLLDRDPPLLVVMDAKGGHQRLIPLHPSVLDAFRRLPLPRDGYLFSHFEGRSRHIEPWSVSHKVGQHLRACGIDASAHQLRHRFGSAIYAASRDIRITQELLGHQSPATTAVYAAWNPTDAAAAVLALPGAS